MARSVADGQAYLEFLRSRAVVISLVYEKSLKKIAYGANGAGNITNLMSVDASKILEVCCYLMYVWSTHVFCCILDTCGWYSWNSRVNGDDIDDSCRWILR